MYQSSKASGSIRLITWPRALAATAAVLLLAAYTSGESPKSTVPLAAAHATAMEVEPSDRHRRAARVITEVMDRQHYRQADLDDSLSRQVFDGYLESLDGNRSYLLAADVEEFSVYRDRLDDALRSGDLLPPFAIYARLQQRNRERIAHALQILETEPDFTIDEEFSFDRSKQPWPASVEELDDLWRKRVKNDALSLRLTGMPWPEIQDTLRKRYQRVLKRIDQVSADDVFETFMNAFSHAYDPHSSYLSPRNSEEYNIAMSLSYEGIGASLQLIDDYVTVMNVLPGGPAALSGDLKVNDRITAVGQGEDGSLTDVIGWRLDDVVQLIRGPVDTVVRLQVLPAGATPGSPEGIIAFTRNKVTLEAQAAHKELQKQERDGAEYVVGIIDVPNFYQDYRARTAGDEDYRSTTRDVRRLVEELKAEGMDALVVDLRNNGGGHLSEATGLVGLFVDEGPVVQLRETGGKVEVLDDPEPGVVWEGPLVVLVNRASASASEIFAGAIQDYQRGLVVGQQTYGKGSVQNLYPLDRYSLGPRSGFGQLTVTIGKYYRVTGESTQHRGVTPDIELPSLIDLEDIGESTRESALPWDTIKAADFRSAAAMNSDVGAELANRHDERARTDADLLALEASREAFDRLRQQQSLSLQEERRLDERNRLDAERLGRENQRRAARGEPALESVEALAEAETPDAQLEESVRIALDLLASRASDGRKAAVSQPKPLG